MAPESESSLPAQTISPLWEDLIERLEVDFQIELLDFELSETRTVGDLYTLILSKLEAGDGTRTTRSFYRLRKALIHILNLPGKSIRPATKLALLLPEPKRIAAWKRLQTETMLELPKLRHPRWARDVIRSVALIVAIAAQWLLADWTHPRGLVWIPVEFTVLVVLIAVRQGLYAMTAHLALGLPVRTVGELARTLMETNPAHFKAEDGTPIPFSRKEAWEQIASIFSEFGDVPPETVTPETRWGGDLRIS